MGVPSWSLSAARNAIVDPLVRAMDGASARSLPAMIRAVMAAVRAAADDQGGAITTSGSDNAYVATTASGVSELRPGLSIVLRVDRTNTEPPSLNVDGLGPRPWCDLDRRPLAAGALVGKRFVQAFWDDTAKVWCSPITVAGSSSPGGPAVALIEGDGIALDEAPSSTRIRQDYRAVARANAASANGLMLVQDSVTGAFSAVSPADLGGTKAAELVLTGTTAAPVSGQRALRLNLSGGLVHASASDVTVAGRVVGISRAAAIAGDNVEYAFGGSMTDSAWNWSPGPVYLGENGTLTQAVPNSGVFYPLGTSDRPTRILISIGPSIRL